MTSILLAVLTAGIIIYFLDKNAKAKQAAADARFKAVILALEEKAKQDGTFKQSYFKD